jgi:hypothetical protein
MNHAYDLFANSGATAHVAMDHTATDTLQCRDLVIIIVKQLGRNHSIIWERGSVFFLPFNNTAHNFNLQTNNNNTTKQ